MADGYVHGYEPREGRRLADQAKTLSELLHADTAYAPGNLVLEAGCGVGAQTVTLASRNPGAHFVALDLAMTSLRQARQRASAAGLPNVVFLQGDVFQLPFAAESFDHLFVCFLLEHLARPLEALRRLAKVLRPEGTITVIEGDHGSAYFHPDSDAARQAIACQVRLQAKVGGNANIGRALYPLLVEAGFGAVRVSPRQVYADASRPGMVDGFIRKTFTAMIASVREAALQAELIDAGTFDQGIRDLERTTAPDGVFCYTFFKAVARQPARAMGVDTPA